MTSLCTTHAFVHTSVLDIAHHPKIVTDIGEEGTPLKPKKGTPDTGTIEATTGARSIATWYVIMAPALMPVRCT